MKYILTILTIHSFILGSDYFLTCNQDPQSHPYNGPIEYLMPLHIEIKFDFKYLKMLCKKNNFLRLNQLFIKNKISYKTTSQNIDKLIQVINSKVTKQELKNDQLKGILKFLKNRKKLNLLKT